MNNALMMENSKCPKCGKQQNFFAHFNVNISAKCLDVVAACHNENCDHEAVISLNVEQLLQASGELAVDKQRLQ